MSNNKAILIVSQANGEATTNDVIDWIDYFGVEFVRINGVEFIKDCSIKISNASQEISKVLPGYSWDNIGIAWFRRWMTPLEYKEIIINSTDYITEEVEKAIINQLNQFLLREAKSVYQFLIHKINTCVKVFGRFPLTEINKLIVLDYASSIGLNIPCTSIINNKDQLPDNTKENIAKAISNGRIFGLEGKTFGAYTEFISESVTPEKFSVSLCQGYVNKEFEIRAFLLEGSIYSMAIFSQINCQTKTDFRKYDNTNPNRTVPFSLPKDIQEKLALLADKFEMKSCSFDLIYTKKNEYIFLEVNPGGQFGMVSYPCNYYLERKLALALIHNRE